MSGKIIHERNVMISCNRQAFYWDTTHQIYSKSYKANAAPNIKCKIQNYNKKENEFKVFCVPLIWFHVSFFVFLLLQHILWIRIYMEFVESLGCLSCVCSFLRIVLWKRKHIIIKSSKSRFSLKLRNVLDKCLNLLCHAQAWHRHKMCVFVAP